MFLSRAWTAKELAEMNVVNYAVPATQLDAVFDDIMARLSARPASVLAHTKRVCNKHVIHQANLARDLSGAYEILDLWQHGSRRHHVTAASPDADAAHQRTHTRKQ